MGLDDLESFIAHAYEQTARWIEAHPFSEDDEGRDVGRDVGEGEGEG